ncbi:MAG: adenylyltransferase/cytidyltransferase family protein, partial [Candidatus Roizmanbacteria bacterium]|nr:adenylyltransferase/cytidyltransferase family protein [Candidatus Roizmanbacteria bacterium]
MKKVLVGGCFDLIHYGHITFLSEARKQGDYLIVALESDENVKKYKGPNRPIHKQAERAEMLRSLRMVDEVVELPEMKEDYDYFK